MKKGKDDEKPNAPMFPKLHVNDTGKGGPRAPPRNKMALYERLSIPSQRFNPGAIPLNPNNSTNRGPEGTASQVTELEGNYSLPPHLPPTMSSHLANGTNMTTPSTQLDQREKVEDDDFKVPVYVQSQTGQVKDYMQKRLLREKLTSTKAIYSGCSVEIQRDDEWGSRQSASLRLKKQKDAGSLHANSQKDLTNEYELQLEVSEPCSDQSSKSTRSSSTRENFEGCQWEGNLSKSLEHQDSGSDVRMHNGDAWFHMKSNVGSQPDGPGNSNCLVNSTRYIQNGGTHTSRCHIGSVEDPINPIKANSFQKDDDRIGMSFQLSNLDKCDTSTISMVDVVSDMCISPDDVVAILGQKCFWKARRAIVNQQRVFAVQVFELHRLIKVQQLIAGSPEVLLEDTVFLEKSSPAKKIRLEYVTRPQAQTPKCENNPKNANHKIERSAENAVGKPSISSMRSSSHLSNYRHISGNSLQTDMSADTKMSPWCFPQPGHQWLVPVMSPSEGLVYKPSLGPAFSGSFPGGCGPYGPYSWAGSFMNAVYGWPAPHQGVGVVPGTQPVSHSYFLPPFDTRTTNSTASGAAGEQMNHVVSPYPFTQRNEVSAGVPDSTMQQMPSDVPNQRDGAVPRVVKLRVSKEIQVQEVQGSTASSPSEIVEGVVPGQNAEGADAFPPFPVSPSAEQRTGVIKVVPHNRRTATESAARIFQSIQEERKHTDSAE